MDARVTKERLHIHIQYDWLKYILIVISSILIWVSIFSWVNNPSNKERFEVVCFFTPSANTLMRNTLSDDRTAAFGADSGIREFELVDFNDQKNVAIFDSRLSTTDACIMPRITADTNYYIRSDYFFKFEDIEQAGYWSDAKNREIFAYLESKGALYRYHLSDKALAECKTEEEKEYLKEISKPYEGKVMGILLNKIPSAENGCFFVYDKITTDDEGNEITPYNEEYVLMLNKINLNKKSGGDNKGIWNATNSDPSHAETFDWITYLFTPNPAYSDSNGRNIGRYCAA